MKRLTTVAMAATILLSVSEGSALAGTYEALCGDLNCRITIDARGVTTPNGLLPAQGVIQWYVGGEGEAYKAAEGVAGSVAGGASGAVVGAVATCWTIILCPFGLIGGAIAGGAGGARAGRRSDYTFTVIGYSQEGDKKSDTFRFVNGKPARNVSNELPVMTGLAMGQVRSLEAIAEGLGIELDRDPKKALRAADMPATIGRAIDSETDNENCWSTYLDCNPAMQKWAEANPAQAEQNKKRFEDC